MTEALKWKLICCSIVAVVLLAIGFFIGRKTVKIPKPETITEYITLPPIHDSIPYPKPVYVESPIDTAKIIQQCIADGIYQELWPTDTITINKNDTTAIMADWATKRAYKEVLFDSDTLGNCSVDIDVQYNRIRSLEYTFVPVQKNVNNTVYQQKSFEPFVGVNGLFSTDGTRDFLLGVNAGAYFKNKYGVNVQYQHSVYDKTAYFGGGVLLKF